MQAPSSFIIFSISGSLDNNNNIKTGSTATVSVKDESDEWVTTDLTLTPSNQTVEGEVNAEMDDVTRVPLYCQGIFTDMLSEGYFRLSVASNSISISDTENEGFFESYTIVEVKNANGSPSDENGPWNFIISGNFGETPYTGKFYVSKTPDYILENTSVGDGMEEMFQGVTPEMATTAYPGVRVWVTPYCSDNDSQVTKDAEQFGDYSPLFKTSANARSAGTLGAFWSFTFAFK